MKINEIIRIERAKRKDAKAEFPPAPYHETIERLRIKMKNHIKSYESFEEIINESSSFSEMNIDYLRQVINAAENRYQKYQREEKQNPGTDLQWLGFIRKGELSLQKKIENLTSLQSFREKYYQWKQGISKSDFSQSIDKLFGVSNAS